MRQKKHELKPLSLLIKMREAREDGRIVLYYELYELTEAMVHVLSQVYN